MGAFVADFYKVFSNLFWVIGRYTDISVLLIIKDKFWKVNFYKTLCKTE